MLKKLLLGLLVVAGSFFLVIMLAWAGLNWYGDRLISVQQDRDFTIDAGDSLGRISARLASAGIIKHPELFQILARVNSVAGRLQAGDYLIEPDITYSELLSVLVQGRVRYYTVTLVEGWTLKEALAVLNDHPKLSGFVDADDLVGIVDGMGEDDNPEGLFYPDTYSFESGTARESIMRIAHERLESVLADEWEKRAEGLPYDSPYDSLIMASIIEKETGVPAERPDIASVFVLRLQKRMRLQTDPTVIYGLGDRYQGGLNRRMLRERTPYNTYVIRGLPPTPIALVGRAAIRAALNPSDAKALYFVARGDGTHYFSETLSEHNRAVRKYQIFERRDDYRSTVE